MLVTRFLGTGSVGEVVDFTIPRHPGSPLMRPGPVLVRGQRAVRGTVVFTITCRPAFDFGRQDHAVHAPDHGGAVFTSPGAQAERVLRGSQRFSVARAAATATVTLGPEEGLDLLLEWGGPHPPRPAARARRHPGPQNATGPRELHWIDGASHNDLYYKEQYVGPAITKLADFFTSNLAAVDTTPAQAASA